MWVKIHLVTLTTELFLDSNPRKPGRPKEDDPVMAGKYVSDFKFGSNQLLGAAQYVNSQIEQNEASGMTITPDEILSWGKEGLGKAAVETAVETVNQTSEAENETADAEPIDREQWLMSWLAILICHLISQHNTVIKTKTLFSKNGKESFGL